MTTSTRQEITPDAGTLACAASADDPAESFVHFRELEHEKRQAEDEIFAAGGWITGHCCGNPRCAL